MTLFPYLNRSARKAAAARVAEEAERLRAEMLGKAMVRAVRGEAAHERMSPAFEKLHLGDGVAMHHFTQEEPHADPHSHPADFTTTILTGGYVEEVFTITDQGWTSELIERLPGHTYEIAAEHIHRIVSLPEGECWTLVSMGTHRRTTRFWRFGAEVMVRDWDRVEWVAVNVREVV